ncbi:MAG: outer membrane lipid asymmetry maintenance protein MlaD [Alphaproteobacteria bacterium]|nr:outer membrane lipid asymmetry maintenance protein MlaD [Alphaproteobacteria bacterium]MCY4318669.1 outer membrane lipid asymmetry maintenance protein MlaD [Alphaproteobacteria bacterium]
MRRSVLETIIGAAVLLAAGAFVFFAYSTADLGRSGGYEVTAEFDNIGGLAVGADVRMSGIKIGAVSEQNLDTQTFAALVTLSIDSSIKLPTDSSVKIASESLLGGKYVQVTPGAEDDVIPPGGRIRFAQSSVSIEDLIGRFIFSGSDDKKG